MSILSKKIFERVNLIKSVNQQKAKHELIKTADPDVKTYFDAVYNESINRKLFEDTNRTLIKRIDYFEGNLTIEEMLKYGVNTEADNEVKDLVHWLADRKIPDFGVGGETVLKILKTKNELREPMTYMGCSTLSEKNLKGFNWENAVAQLKVDGLYIEYRTSTQQVFTRSGKDISDKILPCIPNNIEGDYRICGEIIVFEDNEMMPRQKSNGIINSKSPKDELKPNQTIKLICYDLIEENFIYSKRFEKLAKIIENEPHFELVDSQTVSNLEQVTKIANDYIAQGLEGCVLKDTTAKYENKRSKKFIKVKAENDADLRIVELVGGAKRGKHKDLFGSIKCVTDDGLEVNVTGLSDKLRQHIFDNFEKDYKGKIVEVIYNCKISNNGKYSLFLPRFRTFDDNLVIRQDKDKTNTIEEL